MSVSALVLLAEGAEEMETVITVDILRRADIDVTLASVGGDEPVVGSDAAPAAVRCSRGVVLVPDTRLELVSQPLDFSVVVLPGGLQGAETLAKSALVGSLLTARQHETRRHVAAICAAPTALAAHGVFHNRRLTSYPGLSERFDAAKYQYCEDRVVVDGNLITSRGPGTAFEFSLAIVEQLCGAEKMAAVKQPLLMLS